MQDVRWKQRFQNFEKAYGHFREIFVEIDSIALSEIEKTGGVQRFEFTFELAWKVLKDFLEYSGIEPEFVTPRSIIKEAFAAKLIRDGKTWIAMMETRNLLSHTYNETNFRAVFDKIKNFYAPAFEEFLQDFRTRS